MANAPTGPGEQSLPAEEEIVKILSEPNAPPMVTLDLTNSDGDITGIMHASLDKQGNLVLKDVS